MDDTEQRRSAGHLTYRRCPFDERASRSRVDARPPWTRFERRVPWPPHARICLGKRQRGIERARRLDLVPSSRLPKIAADDCFARKQCSDAPRPKGSRLSRSAADCAFSVLDEDPSGLVGAEAAARVQQVERLEAGRNPEDVCGLGDLDARA
jgi:hypothetical protein